MSSPALAVAAPGASLLAPALAVAAPGASLLAAAPFACAEDIDAALAHVLQPPVEWGAISGVIHTCALYEEGGGGGGDDDAPALRNIIMGDAAPRSLFDWLILSTVRARSSALVASGASLRAEGGGAVPLFAERFREALRGFRARAGLEPRGAVCVLSRGELPLEPAWDVFARRGGGSKGGKEGEEGGVGGAAAAPTEAAAEPFFSPVVVLPDAAARERLRASFAAAGAAPPPCIVGEELAGATGGGGDDGGGGGGGEVLSARRLIAHLRALQARDEAKEESDAEAGRAGSGGNAGAGAGAGVPLPRRLAAGTRHLSFVECGPSVTHSFYSGAGGAPLAPGECPVDWLLLSSFRGAIAPAALGAPLVRRAALERIFERVAAGAARGDGGEADSVWTFELLRRRRGE